MTNGDPEAGGAQKSGMSKLAKVGIGCGALVVLGILIMAVVIGTCGKKLKDFAEDAQQNPARAAALMITRANPDLDIVDSDDDDDTVTIRNNKTGEQLTVNLEDIKEGRIRFTTDEGEMTISGDEETGSVRIQGKDGEVRFGGGTSEEIPDWVPVPSGVEVVGTYTSASDDAVNGAFGFSSSKAPGDICDYYAEELEKRGFELSRQTMSSAGMKQVMLTGQQEERRQHVNIVAALDEDGTTVRVMYNEQK